MSESIQRAVLPHLTKNNAIDIDFKDVVYMVSQGRKDKMAILKGVSGKFRSGELTAIMGPSGAGKTSLLNILTGFQCYGIQGTINNKDLQGKKKSSEYKMECCYILQDDRLDPSFSVLEIMTIAANLKLGPRVSKKSKDYVIEDILDTLSLTLCKHTRCSRLSGGQKKRLSIALELIDNPPVMFLDEPTTGLDSSSSMQCIKLLKSLARGGRTIVCTIHQPSTSIYKMFDHVYVVAEGQCIYQGSSNNTVDYLSRVGLCCPEYHNPADYLLEVANGDYGCFTEELADFAKTTIWRENVPLSMTINIEEKGVNKRTKNDDSIKRVDLVNHSSEWNKFIKLLQKSFLQLYRNWTSTIFKLLTHILVGILIGFFFLGVGNDASNIITNYKFLMVNMVYLSYASIIPAVIKFPSKLPILKKELFNNWYNLKTYYYAFMVTNIPMQIMYSFPYTTITYFMTSQPCEWSRFSMFLSISILVTIVAESIGILFGTLVNPVNGTFLGAIWLAVTIILAGFAIFLTHMSRFFYTISFTSFMRYGLQGFTSALYGYNRDLIPCPDDVEFCPFMRPIGLLKHMGLHETKYWLNAVILLFFVVILRAATYCTLKRSLSRN